MKRRCMGCMETYSDEYEICPYCGYVEGSASEEAIHMQPNSLLHDRYIVGKVLGFGGFGVTYIAWDGRLEQKVAIKEYLPSEFSTRMPGQSSVTVFNGDKEEQFQSGLDKFIDEAKRLAKFQNEPGIVKIFDSFVENGTAYIVMEYLDGETLTQRLKREKTIPEDEAIELVWPILESLKTVHGEGIIHRDIAPDNIFLTKNGEVKLIDFGASRFATTSHSRSLTVIVKPGYSPEEQYRSRGDQGSHTDVYAIASVLYKMITGKTPPDAMERRAKIETQKKDILEEPHKLNADISLGRENAILNAMNVQVEDRTPDIATFMSELNADPPVKRRYGKIKKVDLYRWPLWLKILIPSVLALFITFGVLLATGVISFKSLFSSKVEVPDRMVVVPSIESMEKDEAIQLLKDLKINVATAGNVESEYVDVGKVVLQNPNAGTYVYEYGTVYITISSGKGVQQAVGGIATVPYVIWDTKEDAISKLQQAALGMPEFVETHDDSVAAGKVIAQSLEYGTEVEEGTVLTLTISLGPESFTMPNTKGMAEADAIKLLSDMGLNVSVERSTNNDIEAGLVSAQSIEAGTTSKPGENIVLTISTGSEETTVQTTSETTSPAAKPTTSKATKQTTEEQTTQTTKEPTAGTTAPTETQHTHSYTSNITKEATCGATGVKTYTCSCGDSYTETIPATGNHDYKSEITVQPEVGKEGVRTYTCTVCGDTYTETISALGLSDWTEVSQVPAGAQIKEEKWTYTLTSYTTSTKSQMDGWTQYDTQRTSWGTEKTTYNDPTDGKRKVWTTEEKKLTGYDHYWVYYHRYVCTNPNSAYYGTFGTDNSAGREPRHSTGKLYYQLNPYGTFDGETMYSGYAHDGKAAGSTMWYLDYEGDDPVYTYKTLYHYQEPIYTYYFSKTENKEATSDPTGGEGVSNVKKYVKYVIQ